MDQCIKDLYLEGHITYEDAAAHVRNVKALSE